MTHGLKSLAQHLPQYGRYGDDMVAHISSDEARLLKSLGGSGTINPHTGLPEFFSIGSIFKPVQQAVAAINPFNPGSSLSKTINGTPIVGDINRAANNLGTQLFQPLEKAIVQPASSGLAQFDKAVGKAIPGGWGTIAQTAANFIPVVGPALSVGIGALNGSGVLHKGGKFNLQGAMMGGAMAYGASQLGAYASGAGGATDAIEKVAEEGLAPISATTTEMTAEEIAKNSANQMTNALSNESANILKSVPQPTSFMNNVLSGNIGDATSQLGTKISEGASSAYNSAGNALNTATNLDTYKSALVKNRVDVISVFPFLCFERAKLYHNSKSTNNTYQHFIN
jgi:hypothetical protein